MDLNPKGLIPKAVVINYAMYLSAAYKKFMSL